MQRYMKPDKIWTIGDPGARMDIGVREHGVVERYCSHGIGHPIGHVKEWLDWMGVHGCDGCCLNWER